MNFDWTFFLILIGSMGLAAAIPFQLIPRIVRRASQWGILDFPDVRKPHNMPTPRLGGLTIMPAVWLGCSLALLLASAFDISALSANLSLFSKAVIGFLIGTTGVFLLGTVDDFRRLSATYKLCAQVLVAAIVVHFLPAPQFILGLEVSPWLIQIVFFTWLVIVPNSVNLLDGVDGLTSLLCAIFMGVVSLMSLLIGELGWLLISLPMISATLSFLRFNWRPARIFLGDSGSLLIGFCVAYLSLLIATTPASGEGWNPLISLCLAFVWILDTLLAVIRRYFDRLPSKEILLRRSRGTYLNLHRNALANIVRPDRKHLHHRLMDRGFSSAAIALILSGVSAGFSLVGLSVWSEVYLSHTTWAKTLAFWEMSFGMLTLLGLGLWVVYPSRKLSSKQSVKI